MIERSGLVSKELTPYRSVGRNYLPAPSVKSYPQRQVDSQVKGLIIAPDLRDDSRTKPFDPTFYDFVTSMVICPSRLHVPFSLPSYVSRICLRAYKKAECLLQNDQTPSFIDLHL
jgi:hypothetical protein